MPDENGIITESEANEDFASAAEDTLGHVHDLLKWARERGLYGWYFRHVLDIASRTHDNGR